MGRVSDVATPTALPPYPLLCLLCLLFAAFAIALMCLMSSIKGIPCFVTVCQTKLAACGVARGIEDRMATIVGKERHLLPTVEFRTGQYREWQVTLSNNSLDESF